MREFAAENILSADGRNRCFAPKIECSRCPRTEHYRKPREAGKAVVIQHFEKMGWFIGHSPRKDLCPDCVAAKHPRKEPQLSVVKPSAPAPVMKLVPTQDNTPIADQPKEPTRDQRRLILMKLEGVYLDETTGYSPGWTDDIVARDLGCPVEWVRKLRDENFGPSGSNQEIDQFLAAVAVLQKDRDEINNLITNIQPVFDKLKASEAAMSELLKHAEKIRKAVGK